MKGYQKNTMKKKMNESQKNESQKQWAKGRTRSVQEPMRSFSAPMATRASPGLSSNVRPVTVRSLSATDRPHQPQEVEQKVPLDERYNFAYCDVTSPSEDECDGLMAGEGLKELESLTSPKRVVAALLPGPGLQRAQMRSTVKSFNTRVRDLASIPINTHFLNKQKNWNEDDFKSKFNILIKASMYN